jgi:hypothetical protein
MPTAPNIPNQFGLAPHPAAGFHLVEVGELVGWSAAERRVAHLLAQAGMLPTMRQREATPYDAAAS